MPLSKEKIYEVNGIPVTPRELIKEAEVIDPLFSAEAFKTTSKAAQIIRDNGGTVEEVMLSESARNA